MPNQRNNSMPNQRKNIQKILILIYPIQNHKWRDIGTIYNNNNNNNNIY